MKNIFVAIFAFLFSTNILSADLHYAFSQKDTELCTALATTFDGIDAELLETCIYDAQRIRNTHQCPQNVDTVSCLQTSCNAKPPVENLTEEMLVCLTKHLSGEDQKLMQAVVVFINELTQSLEGKSNPIEKNSQWLKEYKEQLENEPNNAVKDAIMDALEDDAIMDALEDID